MKTKTAREKQKNVFFNRDLSWLEFNARVLAEAARADVPLLERIKFSAIVSSNFEEFFMVRLSGLTAKQQRHLVCERSHKIYTAQQKLVQNTLLPLLKKENIVYVPPKDFTDKDRILCKRVFYTRILPFLTVKPLSSSVIENCKTYAAFLPHGNSASDSCKKKIALIPVPPSIEHIVPLDSTTLAYRFTLAENLIALFGSALFKDDAGEYTAECATSAYAADCAAPESPAAQSIIFKTLGSASFCIDKKNAGLTDSEYMRAVKKTVLKRKNSPAIALICTAGKTGIIRMLCEHLHLDKRDVYTTGTILNIGALTALSKKKEFAHLSYPVWNAQEPAWTRTAEDTSSQTGSADRESVSAKAIASGNTGVPPGMLWERIKQKDRLLHVPYESYNTVLNLLNCAADDERVTEIKITLYRTSSCSAVVKTLEKAARCGKQVTVFIELKARFDELQNIRCAHRLKKAGAEVICKISGELADSTVFAGTSAFNIKVHAKVLLIVRREKTSFVRYVYLSTGNFNEKTACLYSDISLLSANKKIGEDALSFFKYLSGKKNGSEFFAANSLQHLYMSPFNLKSKLLFLINRERTLSTKEKPGFIIAKVNALAEPEIIEALYKASRSHVRIMLNVRGICLLVPGVKNQSEHIEVVSIVDRFLEHSRILYFQNGGDEEVYLSSADWMSRNTDRRVELLFAITQKDLLLRLKDTLLLYFKDNTHSHRLNADGTWTLKMPRSGEKAVRAQESFYRQYVRR